MCRKKAHNVQNQFLVTIITHPPPFNLMKLKHLIIDRALLYQSAEANPFRPIRTALSAQNIEALTSAETPVAFQELYLWMQREDLYNTIHPQKLWVQLMSTPFLFLPLALGIGGIWWFLIPLTVLLFFMGIGLQIIYKQRFFAQKLKLLELETFFFIDNGKC